MDIDRLAPWYRMVEYAAFGRALERCRFAFLARLQGARRVLLVGEGDGRVLSRLLGLAPRARFDVIEASEAMVALARRRVAGVDEPRVRFLQEDARAALLTPAHYDAAATFFFLDCFSDSEARELVRGIERALAPGGLWLHGEFAVPPRGWRRYHASAWIWVMYRFFRITTGLGARRLPQIPALLTEARLNREESLEQRWGMIVSEVWRKSPTIKGEAECR